MNTTEKKKKTAAQKKGRRPLFIREKSLINFKIPAENIIRKQE